MLFRSGMTVLGIRVKNNVLLSIEFLDPLTHPPSYQTHLKSTYLTGICEYVKEVVDQLDRYFRDPSWRFTINLETTIGSVFQQRVWQQLRKIPVGEKYTYGDIAKTLSSSARAVGGACRSNPVPIIVPCHRVVSANGIGGFCGVTGEMSKELKIKRWLLQHELTQELKQG